MYRDVKIIPSRVWQHTSGRQASIYGSVPWTSESDRENWEIVERGYTWYCIGMDGNVTIGACRKPAKTYAEAEAVRQKLQE